MLAWRQNRHFFPSRCYDSDIFTFCCYFWKCMFQYVCLNDCISVNLPVRYRAAIQYTHLPQWESWIMAEVDAYNGISYKCKQWDMKWSYSVLWMYCTADYWWNNFRHFSLDKAVFSWGVYCSVWEPVWFKCFQWD